MSGRQSSAVDQALKLIKTGLASPYKAAKMFGIAQSTIYRALKREKAKSDGIVMERLK